MALAGSRAGYAAYLLPFIVAGVGVSMAIPSTAAAALNAVAPAALGKASAVLNTLRQFGAVFGIAIVTAIFTSRGSLAGPASVTSGYRPTLAAAAGFSVLGALTALAVRRASRVSGVSPASQVPRAPQVSRGVPSVRRYPREDVHRDAVTFAVSAPVSRGPLSRSTRGMAASTSSAADTSSAGTAPAGRRRPSVGGDELLLDDHEVARRLRRLGI